MTRRKQMILTILLELGLVVLVSGITSFIVARHN